MAKPTTACTPRCLELILPLIPLRAWRDGEGQDFIHPLFPTVHDPSLDPPTAPVEVLARSRPVSANSEQATPILAGFPPLLRFHGLEGPPVRQSLAEPFHQIGVVSGAGAGSPATPCPIPGNPGRSEGRHPVAAGQVALSTPPPRLRSFRTWQTQPAASCNSAESRAKVVMQRSPAPRGPGQVPPGRRMRIHFSRHLFGIPCRCLGQRCQPLQNIGEPPAGTPRSYV